MPRAVIFHRLGGPEVLQLEDVEPPPPPPGEVQVRVRALGLNRAEAQFRAGRYIEDAELPSGLGLEAAGVVVALGQGVEGRTPGDRVAVLPSISMRARPLHAELINVPAGSLVEIPKDQTFEQAAATWMAFLTAYGALADLAAVGPGDHVVVTAASSSVGLAGLQVIRKLGATSIAVTRAAAKRPALISAGADHVLVSDGADLAARIREIVGPAGARISFDAVGGAIVASLAEAASHGGMIIAYGALDGEAIGLKSSVLLGKQLTLRGFLVHEVLTDQARLERAKAFILAGLGAGTLTPRIARVFQLEEIVAAHSFLESNAQVGKVVVRMP